MDRIYSIEPFGEINFDKTEEDYILYDYKLNNTEIHFDLNFEKEIISDDILPKLNMFIKILPELSEKLKTEIKKEYKNGEVVKGYIEHHFNDCENEELNSIGINTDRNEAEIKNEMLNKIHLKRIGLYPEYEDFAVFDFTLDRNITQYVIVVNTNDLGKVNSIVIES